jgi:hypothetical protein
MNMDMFVSTMVMESGTLTLYKRACILDHVTEKYALLLNYSDTANMKRILFLLLISTTAVAASDDETAFTRAKQFNVWYLEQINADKYPITDGHKIDNYVTVSTLKKLRHAQDPKYSDSEFYDADFFTKSQYIADDWATNVKVITSDSDPVCLNVYVAYGVKYEHVVIDCMVKENGLWKIQSVAGIPDAVGNK